MNNFRTCALVLTTVSMVSLGCGFQRALPAVHAQSTVLSQLDAASKNFKNVQANVQFDQFTKVVNDHDISSGTMFVERQGASESMGASVTDTTSPSSAKMLNYGSGVLQVYSPATKQVDIFKAGANQAKYESFLTLGFGGSGTDLQAQWTINDMGAETINGTPTEKLDLVGKDPSVRNTFSHVTIWVDPIRGVSLKQIFYEPSGDNRTATYKNIRYNQPIKGDIFRIDAPPGTTKAFK